MRLVQPERRSILSVSFSSTEFSAAMPRRFNMTSSGVRFVSKSRQIKASRHGRRLALAALLISATGCSSGGTSLASLNPFGNGTNAAAPVNGGLGIGNSPASQPGMGATAAGWMGGSRNQASSMGMALKSTYGKGRDALAGMLGGTAETTQTDNPEKLAENDPLLLENAPGSIGPEVFVANGQLWESTGNFERALENYSKALEREPANAPALASVARLKYRQDQFDHAVDYFQRAIAANPSEAGLYNDLGLAQSKLGRHDEAIAAIGKSLAIAPGTSRYANNLATVLFAAGREDEARKTLLANNKPAVAHYNMAYLHYNADHTDQALEELGQVLAIAPEKSADSSSQRAVQKSKELFGKLGGPATKIAQSLPQIYEGAQKSAATASQIRQEASEVAATVRDTATGVTVQLTGGDEPAPNKTIAAQHADSSPGVPPKESPQSAPSTAPAESSATAQAPPSTPPTSGDMFSLPPEFMQSTGDATQTQTATQPTATSTKR